MADGWSSGFDSGFGDNDMAWLAARARIVTVLDAVAITTPVATDIKKVYETPHDTVADWPSVMILGVTKTVERASVLRKKAYTARLRVLVRDADLNRATEILDAFQEAIIDAFDADVTLNGNCTTVVGPNWAEAGVVEDGGVKSVGSDGSLIVRFDEAVAFAA